MSALLRQADLVALFSPSVGQEKAADEVDAAVRHLRLRPAQGFSLEEAIAVLTEIGRAGGLLGIVARLAVARLRAQQAFESARSRSTAG